MHDHDVVLVGENDEPLEEVVIDDGAGRVVRVAHEDHAGALQHGRLDAVEIGLETELGAQRQVHRGRVGECRSGGVDRVARVCRETHVTWVEKGDTDVGDAFLGAQQRHDLGLRVERDAETSIVVASHGATELGRPAIGRILVGALVAHALDQGGHYVGRRGSVGVADAEADDVDAGGTLGGHPALDLGEQVGRQALDARRQVGSEGLGHVRCSRNSRDRSPW